MPDLLALAPRPLDDAKREAALTGEAAEPAGEANGIAREMALSDDAMAPFWLVAHHCCLLP